MSKTRVASDLRRRDTLVTPMGLLLETQNCGLRMRREYRERFSRYRGLVIPTCTTACASRYVWRDR